MGMPFSSYINEIKLKDHEQQFVIESFKAVQYLVAKRLWRIIDDDGTGQIPTEDGQIFDIVAINANAMFSE